MELLGGVLEIYGLLFGLVVGVSIVHALFGIGEMIWGSSPGKYFLKIHIRSANGDKADWAALLIRSLIKNGSLYFGLAYLVTKFAFWAWISNIDGLLVTVGVFLILDNKRQTIYDKIADTAVYAFGETKAYTLEQSVASLVKQVAMPKGLNEDKRERDPS